MSALQSIEWWQIFIGGVATLAIFSFLIRENPIYRIFEHLFMGIATAVGLMASVRYFIIPELIEPLFGLGRVTYPDGTMSAPYDSRNLLFLIPIVFGSLYYFVLSRRFSWIAQIVIGFSLGVSGGNAFKGVLNELLPQLKDSFRPLYIPGDWATSLSNILFVVTLLSAMNYFFFTFRRSEQGAIAKGAVLGRYLMMSCFGAFFGATIMARMALLVERLEFLINRFAPNFLQLWS